jgi:hypothetical protein
MNKDAAQVPDRPSKKSSMNAGEEEIWIAQGCGMN